MNFRKGREQNQRRIRKRNWWERRSKNRGGRGVIVPKKKNREMRGDVESKRSESTGGKGDNNK